MSCLSCNVIIYFIWNCWYCFTSYMLFCAHRRNELQNENVCEAHLLSFFTVFTCLFVCVVCLFVFSLPLSIPTTTVTRNRLASIMQWHNSDRGELWWWMLKRRKEMKKGEKEVGRNWWGGGTGQTKRHEPDLWEQKDERNVLKLFLQILHLSNHGENICWKLKHQSVCTSYQQKD